VRRKEVEYPRQEAKRRRKGERVQCLDLGPVQ